MKKFKDLKVGDCVDVTLVKSKKNVTSHEKVINIDFGYPYIICLYTNRLNMTLCYTIDKIHLDENECHDSMNLFNIKIIG